MTLERLIDRKDVEHLEEDLNKFNSLANEYKGYSDPRMALMHLDGLAKDIMNRFEISQHQFSMYYNVLFNSSCHYTDNNINYCEQFAPMGSDIIPCIHQCPYTDNEGKYRCQRAMDENLGDC